MRIGRLFGLPVVLVIAGGDGCGGQTSGGSGPPPSLASSCTTVCNNVLGQCAAPSGALASCLQGCQGLNTVQGTCVDQFASYLACLGGATSVSCSANGVSVTILSPSCNAEQQTFAQCTGPSLVPTCVGLSSGNGTCGSADAAAGSRALFCVGQPFGCLPAGAGVFGIGPYCCP
jgi:hypothetical protein